MALMSEPVTSLGMTPASSWARFACPARKPRSAAPRLTAQRPPPHAGPAPGGGGDARGCRRDWYIWLEQGRDVNPSSAVMAAIAKALQCTPTEARHLLCSPVCRRAKPAGGVLRGISEGTRRLLDTLMPKPASIQKPNFDIVAWNDSFGHLMGVDFNAIPPEDRNCIYLFLTHPAWRARLGKRDDVLPIFVSYFRAAMAEHRGDPLWEAKLARFAVSEEFKTLWHQRNDVRGVENQLKLFTHPELGIFISSRCTGTPPRETDRGCWSIYPWMRQGRGRWRGWRSRGYKFLRGAFRESTLLRSCGISW